MAQSKIIDKRHKELECHCLHHVIKGAKFDTGLVTYSNQSAGSIYLSPVLKHLIGCYEFLHLGKITVHTGEWCFKVNNSNCNFAEKLSVSPIIHAAVNISACTHHAC